MNADVTLGQSIHNSDTLRVELMREAIENGCATDLDGLLKCLLDPCEIIQQMERDAIKAYKNVMSQFIQTPIIQVCPLDTL